MTLTFTGSDADKKAKLDRIQADIEAANGVKFSVPLTYDNAEAALNRALDAKGLPHGNEVQASDNLRKAALDQFLGKDDSVKAQELRAALHFMGYVSDGPGAESNGTAWGVSRAEKSIDTFLQKNPQYKGQSVGDLYNTITNQIWNTPQQPGTNSYTHLEDYDDRNHIKAELQANGNASFGGPDGVRAVQAQLYMRDPAHSKIPDGVWSEQDQQALIKFRNEENAHLPQDKQIPDLIEMRWAGPVPDSNPPIADRQKDMGARITSALTVSQANWANWNGQNDRKDPTKLLTVPTQPDGTSRPVDIAQMQALLKITKSYKDNDMPTGQWTQRDQDALQGYLNKHKGFMTWNDMPSKVDNMTGKDFQEILKYAMNQVKSDYGMTPALFAPDPNTGNSALVATNTNILQPASRTPAPATAPPPAAALVAPAAPAPAAPSPAAPAEPDVPHKVTANAHTQKGGGIEDNDVAKMQAQLNLMGYYNGQINGKATDTDAAMKDYATKKHIDLHGKSIDDHDVRLELRAAVQKDWDAFARINTPALQAEVDAGHAMPQSKDKSSSNDAVKQMQVVLLAAGGHLPDFGVDGVRWHETDTAYKSVTDANQHLIVKPAAPAVAPVVPPAAAAPAPAKVETPFPDDPMGEGGFITPPDNYNAAPAPAPVTEPAPAPARAPAPTASGDPQGANRSPVVTGGDIGSGRSSGLSAYYNGQAKSDYGSASSFFQSIGPDYIREIGNNRDFRLETMPRAGDAGVPWNLSRRFSNDKGQAFLTGPDGRFAAQYAVNGTHLDYETTYDLTDPAQKQAFLDAKHMAASQDAHPNAYIPGVTPETRGPYPPGRYQQPGGGLEINVDVGRGGREPFREPRGEPYRVEGPHNPFRGR